MPLEYWHISSGNFKNSLFTNHKFEEMKKITLYALSLIVLILASCSNKVNEEILRTVPKDTPFFLIVDLEKTQSDLSQDGKALSNGGNKNQLFGMFGANGKDAADFLDSSKTGIDMDSQMVAFQYRNTSVLTFLLSDVDKFKDFIKEKYGDWEETSGVFATKNNKVFLKNNQAWITGGTMAFNAAAVNDLLSLEEKNSLLDQKYVGNMVSSGSDICGLVNVTNVGSQFGGGMATNLGLNLMFDDLTYFSFTVKFESGKAICEARPLNSVYESAKSVFKPVEIDLNTVNDYPGKGSMFMAAAIDSEQTKMMLEQFAPMAGPLSEILEALKNVEGTVVGSSNGSGSESSLGLMFYFADSESAMKAADQFMEMMPPEEMAVELTGNKLYIHSHNLAGDGIADYSKYFKGNEFGIVMLPNCFGQQNQIKLVTAMAHRDGDSMKILVEAETQQGVNSLVSFLNFLSKK